MSNLSPSPELNGGSTGWSSWGSSDWNRALLETLFLKNTRNNSAIKRIDANPALLVKCTGESSVKEEEAKRAFVASFGRTAVEVRAHFRKRTTPMLNVKPERYPPYFYVLYLSLLAGTADDATFGDGQYRDRLRKIFSPLDVRSPELTHLPEMWRALAEWSRKRKDLLGDCPALILPTSLGKEKLIGYSKQLAFPTYRDEKKLRTALNKNPSLDSENAPTDILNRLHAQSSEFSDGFRAELDLFEQALRSTDFYSAYDTLLWHAISDITAVDDFENEQLLGRSALSADVEEPYVYIQLLLDQTAAKSTGLAISETRLRSASGIEHFHPAPDRADPMSYLENKILHPSIKNKKYARMLTNGWLLLFRDDEGVFSTDGRPQNKSDFLVFSNEEIERAYLPTMQSLQAVGEELTLQPPSSWRVRIYRKNISENTFSRLIDCLENAHGLINLHRPVRVQLSHLTRIGDSVLLNPACGPHAKLPGISDGYFLLRGSNKEEVARTALSYDSTDDTLYPDPIFLSKIQDDAKYFQFVLGGSRRESKLYTLIKHHPGGAARPKPNEAEWLRDDAYGDMTRPLENQKNYTRSIKRSSAFGIGLTLKNDSEVNGRVAPAYLREDLDECSAFSWLREALSVKFHNAQTLDYQTLKQMTSGAAAAAAVSHFDIQQLLENGQWLERISVNGTRFTRFTKPFPTLVKIGLPQDNTFRLIGLLATAEINHLQSLLKENEKLQFYYCENEMSIGAIRLTLNNAKRPEQLATATGLFRCALNTSTMQSYNTLKYLSTTLPSHPPPDLTYTNARTERPALEGPIIEGDIISNAQRRDAAYWLYTDQKKWFFTKSFRWARTLSTLVSVKGKIADLLCEGDLRWHSKIKHLPSAIAREWLVQAGGIVGVTNGEIHFYSDNSTEWLRISGLSNETDWAWKEADLRRARALQIRRVTARQNRK